MDFDFSNEQLQLADGLDRFVRGYDPLLRSRHEQETPAWSRADWNRMAEMGLLGMSFAEDDGGYGGGPFETMVVMEALGRGLVREPFLATVILAGSLLRHAASPQQRRELVPRIAAGEHTLAFAQAERGSRYRLNDVTTTARRIDGGWSLSGAKSLVLHGDSADTLIVSARSEGARTDEHGIGLFLVDPNAPGVSRKGYPSQDGMRVAEIHFADVEVSDDAVLGNGADAAPAISRAVDESIVALSSEAVGAMSAALTMTTEYLKTRCQFGQSIGSFQALQHQAVEMFVELEQARGITIFATSLINAESAVERSRAISAAKVKIGRAAKAVGQRAIQLHGGIGMTEEYQVGHYFKRLTMIEQAFGDTDHHLEKLVLSGSLLGDAS